MNKFIAIGDIHGEAAKLQALIDKFPSGYQIVFLGDYVDRGPNSMRVVEIIKDRVLNHGDVAILGNHEDMMLSNYGIKGFENGDYWMMNGGRQTVASYPRDNNERLKEHLDFLRTLPLHYDTEKYYFVHAGVYHDVPLAKQHRNAKLWIRDEFLMLNQMHEKVIVHGHTPRMDGPEILPHRINLDTGACFMNGRLTALLIDEVPKMIYQAISYEGRVELPEIKVIARPVDSINIEV